MHLDKIKNVYLRESERRRVNKARVANGFDKITPTGIDIESAVSSMGNADLEALHSGKGMTEKQFTDLATTEDPGFATQEKRQVTTKRSAANSSPEQKAANEAFAKAFAKAPKGKQRKSGRWAAGLVKHHGVPVAQAVKLAVAAVKADEKWADLLADANVG